MPLFMKGAKGLLHKAQGGNNLHLQPPPPFSWGGFTDSGLMLRAEISRHKSGHMMHFGFKISVPGPQHTFPLVGMLLQSCGITISPSIYEIILRLSVCGLCKERCWLTVPHTQCTQQTLRWLFRMLFLKLCLELRQGHRLKSLLTPCSHKQSTVS